MQLCNETRYDYLDSVRAFSLILGVVYHASLSFFPIYIGWAVMDMTTSELVGPFMFVSHSFRLPLFFMLAGFFSYMVLAKTNVLSFLTSRFLRLAVPFVIGWLLLRPFLISGWTLGAESMRGDANILNGLLTGFTTLFSDSYSLFTGTHLWFLYYLILITLLILALFIVFKRVVIQFSTLSQSLNRFIDWLCGSPFAVVVLALITSLPLWFMNNWGIDTPDKSLQPHLPVLTLYATFFLFGWLVQQKPERINRFAQFSFLKVAICIVSAILGLSLVGFDSQKAHPDYILFKALFTYCYALMMWTLVSLVICFFKYCLNRQSRIIRYLADAAYWIYLVHLPIVVMMQIAVAELTLHWSIKLGLICMVTLAISLVLYELVVRNTIIGQILNGKRKARFFAKPKPQLPAT